MKKISLFLWVILLSHCAFGQVIDSLSKQKSLNSATNRFNTKREKVLVVKGNITFTTYNLQLTFAENEIAEIESKECKALLKRDTASLKNIWLRDFTLDNLYSEVVIDRNPIPFYTSMGRVIENCTIQGDIAFTSGKEYSQRLKTDGTVEDAITKEFFHKWIRKGGRWKLSTKTYN